MEQLLELKKQAQRGDMQAQFELAMKYFCADGVEKDYSAAAELLEQAAEQGHREAAYNLGICYHHGYGVETDLKTAYQLYLRSALQGYGKGFNLVGDFYAEGIGVRQSNREAIKWYLDATGSKDLDAVAYAEYKLAGFLADGRGVEQDLEQAIVWYEKALSHGELRAKAELQRLGYYDTFRIRPCREEDADAIAKLHHALHGIPVPEDFAKRLKTLLDAPSEKISVAVSEGALVGYIHGSSDTSLFGSGVKRIAAMAVAEQPQEHEIAEALLHDLSLWAAETKEDLVVCQASKVDVQTFDWKTIFG